MESQVIFSERSRRDLEKIVQRIAVDDPTAAARFGTRLIDAAEALAKTPEMGPLLPGRADTRFFPVTPYLVIYRADAARRIVRILRFWHGARGQRPAD